MLILLAILMNLSLAAFSQAVVQGRVTDSVDGAPLAAVSVQVQGTSRGVQTDNNGSFTIEADRGTTLEFNYVGYNSHRVVVGDQRQISIILSPVSSGLNQVVVIGYGTQRKRDIVSAVSDIDMSKLQDVPATNVSRLLTGQAAGVIAKQNSGAPGGEFNVKIRGMSSLGASSAPLYVVDGFPVGNALGQNLNPNDIESISILKDAASSSIYGARGANGVVLITTKRAKAGEKRLDVTTYHGIANVPESRKVKVLNGQEFAQYKKEAFMDKIRYFENREPSIEEVPLDFRYPEQETISTNWYNEILQQNALTQDYNVTLSHGTGNFRTMLSLGHFEQEGALIFTNYKRSSVRINVEGDVNDFIKVGWNLNGAYSRQRVQEDNGLFDGPNTLQLTERALLMDPREPVYLEDGSLNPYVGGHDGIAGIASVVNLLTNVDPQRTIGNIMTRGFVEISFLKHFKFRSDLSLGLEQTDFKMYHPSYVAAKGNNNQPRPPIIATLNQSAAKELGTAADQLLSYNQDIGQHTIGVLVGMSAQTQNNKGLNVNGSDFPDDLVPYMGAAKNVTSSSSESEWSLLAYFSRLNYAFADKYLVSASFRREGSSRFGLNNKWGNFPSVAVGWRLSEESFMPQLDWLNDLKLRASWGVTGNNNIGNYASAAPMTASNYIIGNNLAAGRVVGSFSNATLGWEKSDQLDIGLDLAILNNKLVFTAEYYKKITNDMLLSVQVPSISGFLNVLSNIGKVENKGFEFAVTGRTSINRFNLSSNFNISFNRNKVLEMRGENDEIWGANSLIRYNMTRVGLPIAVFWGYEVLGIFNNQEEIDKYPSGQGNIPGTYRYRDVNQDGEIKLDGSDMTQIGDPHPDFTWGWNIGADYKGFDLNISITGAQGFDIYSRVEQSTMNVDGVFNVLVEMKDRWRSEQNPGAGKQTGTNTPTFTREISSRYVYDGSNIWFRNVSLGYNFPLRKTKTIRGLRIYVSADNLHIFTKYPGTQPEVDTFNRTNTIGVDTETYPLPRTFAVGTKFTF